MMIRSYGMFSWLIYVVMGQAYVCASIEVREVQQNDLEAVMDLDRRVSFEYFEETGLHVSPGKIVLIEDLLANKYRVIKVWFLCIINGGELQQTEEAKLEGIIDVGWFSKAQLEHETVYPEILKSMECKDILGLQVQYMPLKRAQF